jgi:predicted RNA-binding protein
LLVESVKKFEFDAKRLMSKSDSIVLTTVLDSKKEVVKVLGQLVSMGLQDKQIRDLALSLHSKPNHKQEYVGSLTTF